MSVPPYRITEKNIPGSNYVAMRFCYKCQEEDEECSVGVPIAEPFPSIYIAKGFLNGYLEEIKKESPLGAVYNESNHTVTWKDPMDEVHEYVFAIIKVTGAIEYRHGFGDEVQEKFDDIVKGLDISSDPDVKE